MKLQIISLAIATTLIVSCGPTKYGSTSSNAAYSTPTVITTSFQTQYPTATNVVWSSYDPAVVPVDFELNGWSDLTPGDYMVKFDLDTEKYYAWYDAKGVWIGSAYVVSNYTTLPSAVNAVLNEKFNGYNIEMAQKELWKDRMAYEIRLKNGDNKVKLLVDGNGNILKQKTK